MAEKKKINVVLSGGSARGLAHIGVLAVLEKHFKINSIIGASMGAVIGGLYCYGYSPAEIVELVLDTRSYKLFSIFRPNLKGTGLFSGKVLLEYFEEKTKNTNIENCKIKFAAVAYDLLSTRTILIDKGNLAKALRASSSLPLLVEPLKYGKYLFVDGYTEHPFPLKFANHYGKNVVVASSVFPHVFQPSESFKPVETDEEAEIPGMFNVLFKTMLYNQAAMALQAVIAAKPDIYISCFTDDLQFWDLNEVNEFFEVGKKAAEKSVEYFTKDRDNKLHDAFFNNLKLKHDEFWEYIKNLTT